MSYSEYSLPKNQLSQRVNYHPEVDAYVANPETQRICSKFQHSLFRIRQLRSNTTSKIHPQDKDYNKYYIKPELRYKKKSQDPKKVILGNAKESYFYDNLHNQQFWEWRHPFQKNFAMSQRKTIQDKVNPKILQKFRQHIQENSKLRLPMVVRSVLQHKI